MKTKTKRIHNPIVNRVGQLLIELRRADEDTLKEARETLQEFRDSWLVSGDQNNLEGAGECCLADTDLVDGIIPALDIRIDE